MSISVCIATYNGAEYIVEQLNSILPQIKNNDEIVIVDDCSKDNTIDLIKGLQDPRIKIQKNKNNLGHVKTFEKAIEISKNEYVFLSDQDDIWVPNRVNLMIDDLIRSKKMLLSSNFKNFKDDIKSAKLCNNPLKEIDSNNVFRNMCNLLIGRIDYYGCTMLFHKKFKTFILPFPVFVESHDWWIAIVANINKVCSHYESCTVYRRLHRMNVSNPSRPIREKLFTRLIFIRMLIEGLKRKK